MNKKHTVLIICYGFPPIGGGGVPRPLKMAKYLGDFGYKVHVLTIDPAYHATLDPSLLTEVPHDVEIHRAQELTAFLRRRQARAATQASGKQATQQQAEGKSEPAPARPSLVARVKQHVFSVLKKMKPYMLIPDDHILWYPQAVKVGRELMRREKIDVIFSTSGPETNHLVAHRLASECGCKWVADFRDPWTQNMHRSGIAFREKLEEWMEEKVFNRADAVTTVTATFAENFRNKYQERIKRLELIYNGFDQADFVHVEPHLAVPERFHAVYAGILYKKRNPRLLLGAIKELIDAGLVERSDIMLSFAGVFDYPGYSDNRDEVNRLGLDDVVREVGNLPHKQALGFMKGADVLLLIGDVTPDAGAYIPGKLYEYMGIGKPILALNMAGEATEIMERFGLGQVADPTDKEAMKVGYLRLYQEWKAGRAQGVGAESVEALASVTQPERKETDFAERVKLYERREQARQLATLMDELLG